MAHHIFMFNGLLAIKIKYIYITMRKHLAASKGHVEYFQYYLQGATLSLDRINYFLLSDVLEISVCWSVISIQM
jgi:hypothetical protein